MNVGIKESGFARSRGGRGGVGGVVDNKGDDGGDSEDKRDKVEMRASPARALFSCRPLPDARRQLT